jgi:hypothetical protein
MQRIHLLYPEAGSSMGGIEQTPGEEGPHVI